MSKDTQDIKGLRALYESKKKVMVEDATLTGNADKLTKFQLIDKLLLMTKFSEKFLKKMDEEGLRTIFKTFMSIGRQKVVKDLSGAGLATEGLEDEDIISDDDTEKKDDSEDDEEEPEDDSKDEKE